MKRDIKVNAIGWKNSRKCAEGNAIVLIGYLVMGVGFVIGTCGTRKIRRSTTWVSAVDQETQNEIEDIYKTFNECFRKDK